MGFIAATRTCLSKFINIQGRASRSEFWWFALFNAAVQVLATLLDIAFGLSSPDQIGLLAPLAMLALLLPNITVSIRRLHDRDMSGWWLLIVLFPILGLVALLVIFMMTDPEGENRFGPDPRNQ